MRHALALLAVVGCGDSPHKAIDATMIDAPVDARPDAPPPPPGHQHYVVDHEHVPTSTSEARQFALDLGGPTSDTPDGTVDNQLGAVLSAFAGQGFDITPTTDHAVDTGAILMLLDYRALDLTTEADAGLQILDGANPDPAPCASASDTVCRHHLAGSGSFTVASTTSNDPELAGAVAAGTFTGGPGAIRVQFAPFGGTAFGLDLVNARVVLKMADASTIGSVIVGGGVTQDDLNNKLYPNLQASMMAAVTHDCTSTNPNANPPCGCADNTTGRTAIGLFDTSPKDCAISVDEVKNNTLIKSLFAPDVCSTASCSTPDLLSVGVELTAVHAGF